MRLSIAFIAVIFVEAGLPYRGADPVPSFISSLQAAPQSAGRPTPQGTEDVQIVQGPRPATPIVRDPSLRDRLPAGTATIDGVVVSADGGRPVRRATVRLSGSIPGPPRMTQADE